MLTREQLTALASVAAPPAVSIFLPTHEKARETRQDPIRLKNALAAVTQELLDQGQRRPDIDRLLGGAQALLEDELFWRHQRRGLAVFAARDLFQAHRLPIELPELQLVGTRPHIRPLLPLLEDDGLYFVLAVSAGATRLYRGSRFALEEIDAGLPQGVEAISAETDYENTRHAAPPARPRQSAPIGMPASHNFGETPEEQRKVQLVEHLRRVKDALAAHLGGSQAPVVLVAAPEVRGHLRALATDLTLHDEDVPVDPGALSADELHRRSYELVRPTFARGRQEALARLAMLHGRGDAKAEIAPAAVADAAREGRVDTLFIAEGPGGSDHRERIDEACLHTLVNGGHVHVVQAADLPAGAAVAAIFRF